MSKAKLEFTCFTCGETHSKEKFDENGRKIDYDYSASFCDYCVEKGYSKLFEEIKSGKVAWSCPMCSLEKQEYIYGDECPNCHITLQDFFQSWVQPRREQ